MTARIYQPTKNAMQSGKALTKHWVLEYEVEENTKFIDPLMGWSGNSDMKQEIHLKFPTLEAAKKYAHKHEIDYYVILPKKPTLHKQSYADNFTS